MHTPNSDLEKSNALADSLLARADQQPKLLVDILNTITDRVFLKDDSGRITFVNEAFLKTYDYTAAEVLGRRSSEILPYEMAMTCQHADKAILETGKATCLVTHWTDETTGARRWSETHKSALRDRDGKVIGIVGISRDATARRDAEEELNRQKTLLELIVQTVPDEIFVKDCNRRILLANHAFYTNRNLSPEETLYEDPTEELPDDLQRISQDSDHFVLTQGQTWCRELNIVDGEGNEQVLEVRKLPLREAGEIKGIVAVCRDQTEIRQSEERAKRQEALLLHASRLSTIGELAAGIAHEVNQPLFSILNYAKAVENVLDSGGEPDMDSLRTWVRQIRKEATRGGKITQRLKSFVKPADTQREPTNLNSIVMESVEFMTREAHDANISIEICTDDKIPTVLVDRIQIQQVLVNLLKNGLESLSEHQAANPRLVIFTRASDDGVEVTVADNGPGVTTNDRTNILEAFQTTKHDGLGLGLAISNTIVETHHGSLSYFPNDWGGATFSMTLPVHVPNSEN